MRYERIIKGKFLERPNRFLAYAELTGKQEIVHVKNTGRCAELLKPGTAIYVQESDNPDRKTKWDLICVEKGERLVNMDSQIPNKVVQEWIEEGHLFEEVCLVRPEKTYGDSRFDLYVEAGKDCGKEENRKIFIEVKGVTLEENGVARFPDAPSDRAVKHLEELCKAVKEGYEAYVFFVIQMKGVRYFTPNIDTHPVFCETLKKARAAGVHVLAYDCIVTTDSIRMNEEVPVVLGSPILKESVEPLVTWYRENHRQLPWRENPDAYRVWVSEIMLQQTRVEAVKPYYERFLNTFPNVEALADAEEDKLMKLWEGLGYYNRVRNMQKAARQVMTEYGGRFPDSYDEILKLTGIGNYTAGAISSFAYGIPKPAVDGNVLRVVSRLLASDADIMKASVRTEIEHLLEEIIPEDAAGDFNQGLIELGAIVCVPNGEPKCDICPAVHLCKAKAQEIQMKLPVKTKAKARRIEKRTVLIFRDSETVAIRKRSAKGLLAGLYELPNVEGHLTRKEVIEYGSTIGLTPVRVKKLAAAKHIFSHVEWHMIGYEVLVDELEKNCNGKMIFAGREEINEKYSIPSAFEAYIDR
ncbi:A/G-specific adenine glycosylase [Mediterraneibacter agrestimuris]|uniref:A/G-specific adenine glycosylase n=1 Tax=Mediterraneibacter agrestimuris TaxID=2941333 RepID=UPI002040C03F|nr:A/G-specific adenine glycosylase [Mediterraneibacter agrestimuris]